MKIKILKDKFGYKANEIVEIDAQEAADLIAKGFAEEVKANPVDDIVASLEARVIEVAEKVATEAAAKTVDKVGKAFSKKASIFVGDDRADLDPQKGFKGFGDFASAVRKSASGSEDLRLKSPSGNNETTAADGGYAVPVIYADQIFQDIMSGDNFLPKTTQFPLSVGNVLKVPADNTTTIGASGVTGAWIGEGNTITSSKAVLRQISLQPYKLGVLTYVTDELLTDNNVALETYLVGKASYALNYSINNAIVRGDGSSKPTGFIGHAATVTVPRSAANKVAVAELAAMKARFYGDESKAVWVMNREVWGQLATMAIGNFPTYLKDNNAASLPFNTLFGIPVIVSEHMSTLGVAGDIALCDFSKYYTATIGGVNAATSMHLKFDTQELAYRWTFRIDGRPARTAVLTPASGQGSKTLSPFVVLDSTTTTY